MANIGGGDDDVPFEDDVTARPPINALRPHVRLVGAATSVETRPDIVVDPDEHVVAERMADVLAGDENVYQRAGQIVHVVREHGVPPRICEAFKSWVGGRVSARARCVRRKWDAKAGETFVQIPPPAAIVQMVCEAREWRGIRRLTGILEAPSMRPDGTVLQTPGYDAATGYLLEPTITFPAIKSAPTQKDASVALRRLRHVFVDFPFVGEAHLSAVIAGILTLVGRPAIDGSVPAFLIDASTPGSGKSLTVDIVSAIATGRPATRGVTFTRNDEELEKVIGGYARKGVRMLNFDNVASKFGGPVIDKILTSQGSVDLRILGQSEIQTLPWTSVVFASGNNLQFKGDTFRRVLRARIEPREGSPESRTGFKISFPVAWVIENRGVLVASALVMLRAYVAAGRPDMGCPQWGSFEGWARLIPHAIVWAGGEDPSGARQSAETEDGAGDTATYQAIVDGLAMLERHVAPGVGLSVGQISSLLFPPRGEPRNDYVTRDLIDAVETLTGCQTGRAPSARDLGYRLRIIKGRWFGSRRLINRSKGATGVRWGVDSV